MNIRIICIGKLKESYWRDAVDEYMKRLSAYAKMEIVELKESRSDDVNEEGERILAALGYESGDPSRTKGKRSREYVITLEIKGKAMSSEQLADKISELALQGKSDIAFVIGGSCGLSNDVSSVADMKLSFSKMTFPHQMMRVILMEQIYRSFKINRNESYHK